MTIESSEILAATARLATIPRLPAPLRLQVVEELRQSIIAGRLKPGSRLVERELIAMLGVSRTVIREALRQLESEGLIAIIPNKGPVVRELTRAEARELYTIRAVLEGLAARLFVENADEQHLRQLQQALELIAHAYAAGEPEGVLEAKNSFYEVLSEGAGSQTLSSMLGSLHGRIRRWRALGLSHPQRSPRRSQESLRNLSRVLDAIRRRDAERAEKLMREEVTKAAAEATRLLAGGMKPAGGKTS